MLRRISFGRYEIVRKRSAPLRRSAVAGVYSGGTSGKAIDKENAIVCEAYRDLVRAMPCMHCGYPPRSQFAHGDQGKGMGLKTDDRTGWPGCGPHDHMPGCHYLIGSTGTYSKAERRELEQRYAAQTRAEILKAGTWPKGLPMWSEKR